VNLNAQLSLLETIQTIAGERLKNVNFTKSYTGIVRSIDGLKCSIEYSGDTHECTIPHNLSSFIAKDDVVIVQDIDNKNITRIVQGVISTNGTVFNIYDPINDVIVSSVLQLWDEELQKSINVLLELE
jgi:hypothetical protein